MKLICWFRSRPSQVRWMIVIVVMLLMLIATRWGYTMRTAGEAFRQRFAPPSERVDSVGR